MRLQIFCDVRKFMSESESPFFGKITFILMGIYLWFLQQSNYLLKLIQ